MTIDTAGRPSPARSRIGILLLTLLSLGASATRCGQSGVPPGVHLTLNAVPDEMNELLIVPPSGFVVNVALTETTAPIAPNSLEIYFQRWGDAFPLLTSGVAAEGTEIALPFPESLALAEGTYTMVASVSDTDGRLGAALLDFAVRGFAAGPPIGSGLPQMIYLNFDVDRDGDQAPDFPVDLRSYGLGSAGEPALSAVVDAWVREATTERVQEAFWSQPSSGLADDPVQIGVFDYDWGSPALFDTTEICVGGEDPTGGVTIGNIIIDPGNANRTSIECAGLPLPTGVFPAELLPTYGNQAAFQETFDPLMASRGGTPVGQHALDPIVLAPGFDYASASGEEQARFDAILLAVRRFGDALGSIVAHEVGHALGLVAPAGPGVGFYGGQTGAEFSHAILPDGSNPRENHLMKAGYTFDFAELAGLEGHPLPFFRPLSYAYLRDRAVLDSSVLALLPPPVLQDVAPDVIDQSAVQITVTGFDFSGPPSIQLVSEAYTYSVIGETYVDENTVTGFVIQSQALPGLYDLVFRDVDGQTDTLFEAVTVE